RARPQRADDASTRLRSRMAAARVSFTWFGVRRSLTAEQKARAADPFGASGEFLSAGKKLLDNGHPSFRAVTAVRGRTVAYWKWSSLPFPEPGVRLILQDSIDEFERRMSELREELGQSVATLDGDLAELKGAARERLGTLFNAGDYPT